MTEGQIRYQTLLENERHNREMERIGKADTKVAERNAAVRESEEYRQVQLHGWQKSVLQSQAQANLIRVWEGGASTVLKGMQAAHVFFGLFSDAAGLGTSLSGAAGGYYQGSLFA